MKKAFTLLELIIVVIIIGVLASLALPRFAKLVEGTRAAEAMAGINQIRQAIERCLLMSGGSGNFSQECVLSTKDNINNLDIDDPGKSPGAHFAYMGGGMALSNAQQSSLIIATRTSVDNTPYAGQIIGLGYGCKSFVSLIDGTHIWNFIWVDDNKSYWEAAPVYKGMIPKTE